MLTLLSVLVGPTRKPSATLKKHGGQRVCGDEVMPPARKRARSPDSDEDSADVSTPRTSLLSRIRAANSSGEESCHRVNTALIKDALRVGVIYDVIDIETVNTCNGSRQVWSLKGVEDASLKRVFSCADLDRYTVDDDGSLNQQDRSDMIKLFRVVYKGQSGENSKYGFSFHEK